MDSDRYPKVRFLNGVVVLPGQAAKKLRKQRHARAQVCLEVGVC